MFDLNSGDRVNFVLISARDYADLENKDPATVYFITSDVERRIAIGGTNFANYVDAHCTSLSLSETSYSLAEGESLLVTAYTEPASPSDSIVWTSDNSNISITQASSSNKVIITGVTEGSSLLTCTCGEIVASCQFSIHEPYVYEEHILASNYSPNGAKFKYTAPISLINGQYIEVDVELSGITGNKENILSVGQNIDVWGVADSGPRIMMYVTASNKSKISYDLLVDNKALRPTYTADTTHIVMKFDQNGMWINGTQFFFDTDLRATPTISYDVGMPQFLSLTSYDIGSQEGSNRSHALYYTIRYFTTS